MIQPGFFRSRGGRLLEDQSMRMPMIAYLYLSICILYHLYPSISIYIHLYIPISSRPFKNKGFENEHRVSDRIFKNNGLIVKTSGFGHILYKPPQIFQ